MTILAIFTMLKFMDTGYIDILVVVAAVLTQAAALASVRVHYWAGLVFFLLDPYSFINLLSPLSTLAY